jgi:hypothetical protein
LSQATDLPASFKAVFSGEEYFIFEIARLADGTRYLTVLQEDTEVKFLNRTEPGFWYARLFRVGPGDDTEPELLKEGLQFQGNDVTIPVELQLPGIGTTKLKSLRTEIGYNVNGVPNGKPQVYSGRGSTLQVSGSQISEHGKLTVTMTVPEELTVTRDTQVLLRFEPLTAGLPERTAAGKVNDFLTLGSARFVVAEVEPDFSKVSLALVSGNLEETMKQQLQLGAELPAFAQVDLVTRKTVTRESLLSSGEGTSPIVFVFGDFAPVGGRTPYGPPPGPGSSFLPLPPSDIAEQLGLEMDPKPVVVFVTRQIGLDFLYGELRNKTPEYVILTDFADPLRTTFRSPMGGPGGWYGPSYPGMRDPSLRQVFNLPDGRLSVAAFDAKGKVVYVRADANTEFLPALAEARKAMQGQQ